MTNKGNDKKYIDWGLPLMLLAIRVLLGLVFSVDEGKSPISELK